METNQVQELRYALYDAYRQIDQLEKELAESRSFYDALLVSASMRSGDGRSADQSLVVRRSPTGSRADLFNAA
jgi:hypothetical protein